MVKVSFEQILNLCFLQFFQVFGSCPTDSVSNSEACYWIVAEGNEFAVLSRCELNGGTLASIPNQTIQDFITNNLNTDDMTINNGARFVNGYFIGVNDKNVEGTYVNYEGAVQSWTNWYVDEPNDNGSPSQDCVKLSPSSNSEWQDTICDDDIAGICFYRFPKPTFPATQHTTQETIIGGTTMLTTQQTTITEGTAQPTTTESTKQPTTTDSTTQPTTTDSTTQPTTTESTTQPTTTDSTTHPTTTDSTTQPTTTESTTQSSATNVTAISQTTNDQTLTVHATTDTTLDLETTERPTSPSNTGTTSKQCLCVCYTNNDQITSSEELQKKIDKLIEELTIPKKETSQNKRKLISASDNRSSAKGIGYVGATVLILICGLIVGIDALNLCKKSSKK